MIRFIGMGCVLLSGAAFAGEDMIEWRYYAADAFSSKYSPADQINAGNFDDLEIAWRWRSPDESLENAKTMGLSGFKTTPIMVGGVLYTSTSASQVAAIRPDTGETLWVYDPQSYKRGRPTNTGYQHRGVAYWTDGKGDERIIIATGGRQLCAVDAKTGKACESFGANGQVELAAALGLTEAQQRFVGYNAPPAIVKDTIILGSIIFDGPTRKEMPPGHIQAYDVRTGKLKWIFHTIPQAGEFGNDTWKEDSWTYTGNTNVWSMISVDPELGYVYLPVGTPTNDYYGGHRKGDDLFAESLLCLNAETGERVWHFQGVHHGLWDWDFPCAPNLLDIVVNGKKIKAVAQASKQANLYVFDRVTGEPIWPINEVPVPQTNVAGEETSSTQPVPTKPAAFDRQNLSEDDLIDFTPELRQQALDIVKQYRYGSMWTPPAVVGQDGLKGTLMVPGSGGGANWSGAAVDPETGVLYVPSMTFLMIAGLAQPDQSRSNFTYLRSGQWAGPTIQGLQIVKPPYGRITAIDLNSGEHLWQVTHGDGPRNHPLLKDLNLPKLGTISIGRFVNSGGPMLTKTLFFASQNVGEQQYEVHPEGVTGYLYAYEKNKGDFVGRFPLENAPHAVPMTYVHNGRQYIVLGCGGGGQPSEFVALALPKKS